MKYWDHLSGDLVEQWPLTMDMEIPSVVAVRCDGRPS
jgi:hypothetical protein